MTNLEKISEILGLKETETKDTFILDLQKVTKQAKALNLEQQFIKALDALTVKGLDSGYVKAFPNHDADLKLLIDNFAEKNKGKKLAFFVASLRSNYKRLDVKGKEVPLPDAQAKQYSLNGKDNHTAFYSVKYLKEIIKDTVYDLEISENNSMINLAVIYSIPKPVKVEKDKPKKPKKSSK